MKKLLSLFFLFLLFITQAQEKTLIKKTEVTIPIGKKLILKTQTEGNKIIGFEITEEQNISEKPDMMNVLTNFEKDETIDNSIELVFCEAQMMNNPFFMLKTIQKTGKRMTFKAKIRLKGSPLYSATSIMPVGSNILSFEQWKDTIDSIFLYDFELQ